MLGEVVVGMGETLVGNYPGRALGFTADLLDGGSGEPHAGAAGHRGGTVAAPLRAHTGPPVMYSCGWWADHSRAPPHGSLPTVRGVLSSSFSCCTLPTRACRLSPCRHVPKFFPPLYFLYNHECSSTPLNYRIHECNPVM